MQQINFPEYYLALCKCARWGRGPIIHY